ncbi:hypothetical protein AWW66_19970 [Micromonospora rosaria]|uniref:Acetyl-CoA carboxylase biotin carboxyl carrier protein subunit n=1 Tax=Micromonospora rosaria TaxID=47874 RepID=A0A136PP33_9ACTN|nr:acyl-CoA carboxylase subunit epsilon [Micromonospora rosaria]KXK60219.1 hypothetical protein AWW66_19970 [Micromonospora rosaria]
MAAEEPLFRVVRGTPSAEETAALVGVLAARSHPAAAPDRPAPSAWARSGRPPHPGTVAGPGAWRASGLPR